MAQKPKTYTKDELIAKLKEISAMGWIQNARKGNHGGIGNTIEDILGIEENNLPIANSGEWELKTHRIGTSSLITLFHTEPSPRAIKFVPKVFLPLYGWSHKEAGGRHPKSEMCFHQTIPGKAGTDRGFKVVIDRKDRKVLISFDAINVDIRHADWLASVKKRIGLGELSPQPYWGFDDLEHIAGAKLPNAFYVQAKVKRNRGKEYYHYSQISMLQTFSFEGFLKALEEGRILPDFDARQGHNHGTKFRLRQDCWPMLYEKVTTIL